MERKKVVEFLDELLGPGDFPDDSSANGLQLEGKQEINKIGLAVDSNQKVFNRAADNGIDLLFVHHGLIWGGLHHIKGITRERLKILFDSDMNLYACHLPLDFHPLVGNNAELLKIIGAEKKGEFGTYHGRKIGYWGELSLEMGLDELKNILDSKLTTKTRVVSAGRPVKKIGAVSGGGGMEVADAQEIEIDTFITGEPDHAAYQLAQELGVNILFSGHYATETLGVKAVREELKKKFPELDVEFIDMPTGF